MDYFKYFAQASTYVRAAAANSNGFQLIYRILELVHPRLRQSKGGIHKIIHVPSYNEILNDSIYTLLTRYQNYLLYESFSPETRIYNQVEQTMFVLDALCHDSILKAGVAYVELTLQSYQNNTRLNPFLQFTLELEFDNIGIVLDNHSEDYVVG